MSVSSLVHADISSTDSSVESAIRNSVRGCVDTLHCRLWSDSTTIQLQTEVYLGEQVRGKHATERAVCDDIIRAIRRIDSTAEVSVSALLLDVCDWYTAETDASNMQSTG